MKARKLFSILLSLFFVLFSQTISFCAEKDPPPEEKEYFIATVLLIDHETGDIGIRVEDEDTGEFTDLAFKVDVATIEVYDSNNEVLDFAEIQSGDHLNFYTEVNKDGKEHITEITDKARFASEN